MAGNHERPNQCRSGDQDVASRAMHGCKDNLSRRPGAPDRVERQLSKFPGEVADRNGEEITTNKRQPKALRRNRRN
jgi:hypothetical protein